MNERRNFQAVLAKRWQAGYALCVGLDPLLDRVPAHLHSGSLTNTLVTFNQAIIDATADFVCAFKPNSAFYEMHGPAGLEALEASCSYIRECYPEVLLILDAKRADIGPTNTGYAAFAFERCQADAVTVHPYLGREALDPLLADPEHGIFVLCRTSNPGAGEFQDLPVGDEPLYVHVARAVAQHWNTHGNCGLVTGATYPRELAHIRQVAGTLPLLVPGIGMQGGDVNEVVEAGMLPDGSGLVISASRSILFADHSPDFAHAARRVALETHETITHARRRRFDRHDTDRRTEVLGTPSGTEIIP